MLVTQATFLPWGGKRRVWQEVEHLLTQRHSVPSQGWIGLTIQPEGGPLDELDQV